MPNAAAIYARISEDRAGDAAGVNRQLADCRAEAARRGWTVAEEYVDDDISAYSGKRRPAYTRMLDDLADGLRDAVIVYHLDRLHRRPVELEDFVERCERAGVRHVATVHGDVNLGNGDGLLIARIMAAVAANESDAKSRRVRRKMQENAEAGRPHGGANRPFGYEPDRMTVRESEAVVIRDLVARLLARESLASLTSWLNDNDVPTVTGKSPWRTGTVRAVLRSARISGQRETNGEIVGPAQWPAIITPADTGRVRAVLDDPARRTNRTARRYLLAGLLRCGLCGATLLSHPRREVRRYVCRGDAERRGCGKIVVSAERVEELMTEAVLYRLDSPDLAAALSGHTGEDSAQAEALRDQLIADKAQLLELAAMYGNREFTASEWKAARAPIDTRVETAERNLARLTSTSVIHDYIGNAKRLRDHWGDLNLNRQRAIVAALLDHAVVHPATVAGGPFDPDRVKPLWRV